MYQYFYKFLILVIISAGIASCSSFSNKMDQSSIGSIEIDPLKSTEYEIIGDVVGEAHQTWVLGMNFQGASKSGKSGKTSFESINFTPLALMVAGGGITYLGSAVRSINDAGLTTLGVAVSISGVISLFASSSSTTESTAMYNAIENAIGADALIAPRFEKSSVSFWPFYSQETVRVYAKAIRIKVHN